ncbi:ATP-binding cassette domain-containing protein [Streptomyces sp. HNA39]|uniref:ATP-binding cassette domain-containing protein n=1 Tax=Streptomyces sp. HNA39 TaxID=2850561 RepID=UPI0032B167FA
MGELTGRAGWNSTGPPRRASNRGPARAGGLLRQRWRNGADGQGVCGADGDGGRNDVAGRTLLDGLDLTVHQGQSVAVSGPSGSGKSTLLTCLWGLIKPQRGSIQVAGVELTGLRELSRIAVHGAPARDLISRAMRSALSD